MLVGMGRYVTTSQKLRRLSHEHRRVIDNMVEYINEKLKRGFDSNEECIKISVRYLKGFIPEASKAVEEQIFGRVFARYGSHWNVLWGGDGYGIAKFYPKSESTEPEYCI